MPGRSEHDPHLFRLPSEQLVVVSIQMGSGSPPGLERVKLLKEVVADHRS